MSNKKEDPDKEIIVMLCDDYIIQQVSEDLHFFITQDMPTLPGIRTLSPETPEAIEISLLPEETEPEYGFSLLPDEVNFEETTPHKPQITGDLIVKSVLPEEKENAILRAMETCAIYNCNKPMADVDFSLFCVDHFNQARNENWSNFFPPKGSKPQRPRPISKVSPRPSQPPDLLSLEPTLIIKKGKDRR